MMKKPAIRIVLAAAVVATATVLVAQGLDEEESVVKVIVAKGVKEFDQAVKQADAEYFKALDPIDNRLKRIRFKAIDAVCKRTTARLKKIAADATKSGAYLEAAIARKKINIVQDYLAEAKESAPEEPAAPVRPVRRPRSVKTTAARIRAGRHSYLMIMRKVTWDQANGMAKLHGGYLARIETPAEMLFLKSKLGISAWVGGLGSDDSDEWRWQNGKEISARLWSGKPPRGSADSRTVLRSNGLSASRRTSKRDAFIIEWGR